MTLLTKTQIGLLLIGGALLGWQFRHHLSQARELTSAQVLVQQQKEELASRRQVLAALEQRNRDLLDSEQKSGNLKLFALLRGRNTATLAASPPGSETRPVGNALAKILDNPEQQAAEGESDRHRVRAELYQFFKLLNLPPDKADRYVDLCVEMERRKADRLSALLHGRISVAEALRARDQDDAETDQRRLETLGTEGRKFWDGIADSMRNDEARRLLKIVQQNMGGNDLNQEQSDRLQGLIKTEIVSVDMDDVELFRPPDEWTQYFVEHQQKALSAAGEFLSPPQLEALKAIGAYDLADRQKQMQARRTSLGVK